MKQKRVSDEKLLEIIEKASDNFEGDFTVLESAIGALIVGRTVGWHGLRVCHSGRTFHRYEEILDIKFREVLPDRTEQSTRLRGVRMADKIGKFWQAISAGMIPAREAKVMDAR